MKRWGLLLLIVIAAATISSACFAAADEYRAFWVDAWGNGFLNQSQVDQLLGVVGDPNSKGDIRNANCNAIFMQVRRNCDACYPSSMGEPYMSGLTPSDFNALQAVINAAHDTTGGKQRIEVHCWLVTFRTSGGTVYGKHSSTPTGSLTSLDNYWPSRDDTGTEVSDKAFDPGHPLAEEYTTNVFLDLVKNFDIDGVHYDYVRFTAGNQGYNPTSIARYNARYGLTGQPSSTDDQFDQWRRDQISALVRKVYAKVQATKPSVKVSGSFVTWNPSPTASTRAAFQATRPYGNRTDGVFADWDAWMQEGTVDMCVPMTYYDYASLPGDWTNWINFIKDRKFNRQAIIGPGIYLNSLSNAILELQQTRTASPSGNYAQGFSGYSYRTPYSGGTWAGFASTFTSQVCPTQANIPDMPWKSNPTKGHISGTVTYTANGAWADGATVAITGPESRSMLCDGTGFYAFIDLTPGSYTITVSKSGYPNVQRAVNVQIGQVTGNMFVNDFQLGGTPAPTITNIAAGSVTTTGAVVTWTTSQAASSKVEYGLTTSYGSQTSVDNTQVTAHSMTLTGLSQSTTYHYRVTSGNTNGTTVSSDYTFTTAGPPSLSGIQVSSLAANSVVITWTTNTPADGKVNYGLTSGYGMQASDTNTNTTSHSVTIGGLTPQTTYHYQCVSTNAYGSAQSTDLTFTTTAVQTEIVVDNTDPGWSNTSPSGSWTSGSYAGVPRVGSDYLYTAGSGSTSSATRKCRWTPTLLTAGTYDIYVFYQIGTNRNTAAPYKIYYNGGSLPSVQNQNSTTAGQGGWFLIGQDLPFLVGTSGYVELTNASTDTKLVSADAVKWVLKAAADTTAPVMGSVTDDIYTTSTTGLHASWSATDPESGIQRYEYAVGTTSGGTDKKGWTSAGTATSATITGLSLNVGTTYYISARAVNGQGLTSTVSTSPGVVVAQSVNSIMDAKAQDNGIAIVLPYRTVSAKFGNRFYVEEDDQTSGICVDGTDTVSLDQVVKVYGKMGMVDGRERAIKNCKIEIPGDYGSAIQPLFFQTKWLGGSDFGSLNFGTTDGFGVNSIGLLVTIAGKVTDAQTGYIYVDDGCGLDDGIGHTGVRVDTTTLTNPPTKDQNVVMTGICSFYYTGSVYVPQLKPRSNSDMVKYN